MMIVWEVELNDDSGETCLVNPGMIEYVKPAKDGSTMHFASGTNLRIKETTDELMRKYSSFPELDLPGLSEILPDQSES